jgi:hypothetical protein
MNKWIRKFLLVLVAFALAISPLRGALALPITTAADGADHCAQMQDGMDSMAHMAGMQESAADNPDHGCGQGCAGDCCDGACGACAHGSIALSSIIAVILVAHDNLKIIKVSRDFPGPTVHPPFRPPISLLS